MRERRTSREPQEGEKAPIYGPNNRIVGYGTWRRVEYESPEGTRKTHLTLVPDKPAEETPKSSFPTKLRDNGIKDPWWTRD